MLFDAKEFLKTPEERFVVVDAQAYFLRPTAYWPAWHRYGHVIDWIYIATGEEINASQS